MQDNVRDVFKIDIREVLLMSEYIFEIVISISKKSSKERFSEIFDTMAK